MGFGLFGVAAFVLLRGYFVRVARLRRTAVERLASLPCPKCGAPVGISVAAEAKAAWSDATERAHAYAREHLLRIRIDSRWHFTCASCGGRGSFHPEETAILPDGVS
jgi:hypothetical protein